MYTPTGEKIDPNVISALSDFAEVLELTNIGKSAWAEFIRIKVQHTDGSEESYFMKISTGPAGKDALKGEFEATSTIYSIVPDFCPKPIAWGTFYDDPDSHFYLCKFYSFTNGVPEPSLFCERLAELHLSPSPEGKFGFHCTTYNGDLPQDNTWFDSWEAFFAHGLRHILKLRDIRAGTNDELDALLPELFEKVIPRLLRPLETGGRKIKPSLVHGDLWWGNAGIINSATREGIIYDPASFYAHNEYEFGNWRPERNQFTLLYFKAYHKNIPESEPTADYDSRNALYAL
ncbi:alcohol dehydrogenase [Penicillium angulare]|uniref:protein-ribulosamine 3-kinase n=1 Tax=Penicillium angulare TaxID=116970 RepID=A0A9W9K718_9EURO|nr:alcohol dehydrogenase [Penicillium angulare]